ncbi:MAG TPA: hypothetical protein VMS77_08285 [Conexivisphaerales archaeon]|nr:hypothetical protein [Conexivisphaerales archaeon]
MSVRSLEPWERRTFDEIVDQGRRAAQQRSSEWCSMTPLQLREMIARLNSDFKSNWRQIAYLEGHRKVVDDRCRYRRALGESLKGYLEALGTEPLNSWF